MPVRLFLYVYAWSYCYTRMSAVHSWRLCRGRGDGSTAGPDSPTPAVRIVARSHMGGGTVVAYARPSPSMILTPASKVPRNTAPPSPIQSVRGTKPAKSARPPSCVAICRSVGKMRVLTPLSAVASAAIDEDGDDVEDRGLVPCLCRNGRGGNISESISAKGQTVTFPHRTHSSKHDPRLGHVKGRREAGSNGTSNTAG